MAMCVRRVALAAVVASAVVLLAAAHCPNNCNGHGHCDTGSEIRCNCYNGWGGGDCSLRLCPAGTAWSDDATATDTAHAAHTECSNRGLCDYNTGTCQCEEGFEGLACQRMSCRADCQFRGRCVSMRRQAIGYHDTLRVSVYSTPWDADMIHGCDCDAAYEGHDCSLRKCPRGDDPLTHNQVNEVQTLKCSADGGYFVLQLENYPSNRIPHDATLQDIATALKPITDTVTVSSTAGDNTACSLAGTEIQIEFLQRFGDVPVLRVRQDWDTYLTSTGVLSLDVEDDTVQGTKEWLYCSGRGRCNQNNGLCECYAGYYSSDGNHQEGTRGDCGAALDPITTCPGETLECSGHGVCSDFPEYMCACETGWMGGDCSERICPFGPAWFDLPGPELGDSNDAHDEQECSNKGICDRRSGRCQCEKGFQGEACERMSCPRVGEADECSGHGRCMSMEQLAENADNNGDETDYTYGRSTHNAATWDSHSVYGCKCDMGWHGFDCSLMDCPRGDDPHTPGFKEVQTITCDATGGSVQLSFRLGLTALNGIKGITTSIAFDAPVETLKAELEDLDTIGTLEITYTDPVTTLCDAGTHSFQITFHSELGDLPLIKIEDNQLTGGTLSIAEWTGVAAVGTTENDFCSNRGICNEHTGVCQCFTQWSSSNGANGPGDRGDCGYVTPFLPVTTAQLDRQRWQTRHHDLVLRDALPPPNDDDQFVH